MATTKNINILEVHKYLVECLQCGNQQINNDDGVANIVKKVTLSYCKKCEPEVSKMPVQGYYDQNGERVI